MQAPLQLVKANGEAVPNTYIIKLKGHISKANHHDLLRSEKPNILPNIQFDFTPEIFNGYAAVLNADELNFLLNCDHVERVEEDCHIPPPTSPEEPSTVIEPEEHEEHEQVNREAGYGVDIYVLDSGVYIGHKCFQGRARYGKNCAGGSDEDQNGHGTHVAGIAAGQATAAKIISVKVGDAKGGRLTWQIAGFVWVYQQFRGSGRPSVINMSVGGPKSVSMDDAVRDAIKEGVSVVVSAGNGGEDTKNRSPANVIEANVVGAVDEKKVKCLWSNYGTSLKVWAPGTNIRSAWIGSPDAYKVCSGTSQAAPHVAGYIAIALGRKYLVPPNITKELQEHAKAEVTGVPKGTTDLFAQRW